MRINDLVKIKEVSEDPGQDIESDLYAQDTMKNPGPEIIRLAFNDDLDYLEQVMDNVTSDDYKQQTGDDYFWNKHAKIISDNVPGDWMWEDVIAFWDLEDIDKAIKIYQNNFQQNQNVEPGNSTFDSRRRTSESEDIQRLKDLINYRN
tara:strand:+ start:282 stop:725 length:444 start_codon:yes stop_codon:yes gene_type:complete